MMGPTDMDVIKDIPGFKIILKTVLKCQIQQLVDQLASFTDEESVVVTASTTDGSLSYLGSEMGKSFLQDYEEMKSQFLGFCLKKLTQKQLAAEKEKLQGHSDSSHQSWNNLDPWSPRAKNTAVDYTCRSSGMRHEPYKRGQRRVFNRSSIPSHDASVSPTQKISEPIPQGGEASQPQVPYPSTLSDRIAEKPFSLDKHAVQSASANHRTASDRNVLIKTEPVLDGESELPLQYQGSETNEEAELSDSTNKSELDRLGPDSRSVPEQDQNSVSILDERTEYSCMDNSPDSINGPPSEVTASLSGGEEVNVKTEANLDPDVSITNVEMSTSLMQEWNAGGERASSQLDGSNNFRYTVDEDGREVLYDEHLAQMLAMQNIKKTPQKYKYTPSSLLSEAQLLRRREVDRIRQRRRRAKLKAVSSEYQQMFPF